jgi:hypothetical protein
VPLYMSRRQKWEPPGIVYTSFLQAVEPLAAQFRAQHTTVMQQLETVMYAVNT